MAVDALAAAKELMDTSRYRSSVNRSYYSAYCAITSLITERRVALARGWNNPPHEQLRRLVQGRSDLSVSEPRRINRALRRLRLHRENADYRPLAQVDRQVALACIHDAGMIVDR